jgi:hypothetical protein
LAAGLARHSRRLVWRTGTGSHVGLAFNREADRAIGEAPARPELEG